ncbi:MAG: glycosyltransferase [Phycisphaerales bacterium]
MTPTSTDVHRPARSTREPDAPRVSVVMPFRNAAPFIAEAIESLTAQTFSHLEVIAIDDASDDESSRIVESAAQRDPRVRLVRGGPRGFVPSLNRGIELARGEFVARMDADDAALPDRIARQVAFLDAHPDVGVLGGQILALLDGETRVPPFWIDNPLEHRAIVQMLATRNAVYHPTVLLRRELLVAAGGYRPAFTVVQDYDLWLRLAERTRFANLPDRVLRYRFHGGQATERNVELAYLCTWAAQHAARERAAGRPDPIRGETVIDREQVAKWGLDAPTIDAEIAWVRASHRARERLLRGERLRALGAFGGLLLRRPVPFMRRAILALRGRVSRGRAQPGAEDIPTAWPASR